MMLDNWEDFLVGLETEIPTCNYIETNMLNQHNGDKIIGINVRGLKANFSSLEEFMNKQNNPQEIKVMVLTEIFNANEAEKNNYIDSHTFTSTTRHDRSPNHGGVGLLIEKTLNFRTPDLPDQFIEGLIEGKTTIIPELKMIIVAIYRPNGCPNSNTALFIEKLKALLDSVRKLPEYKKFTTYVIGDLNIDLRHTDELLTSEFINGMVENLFLPANTNCDTRITPTSSTLIDHIWCNDINKVEQAFICEDTYISDHLVNGVILKSKTKDQFETVRSRKITETAKTAIKDKLRISDWSNVLEENDSNRKWENLTDNIVKVLDEVCPITEKKINLNKGPPRSPWMSEGLKQSEYTLNKLSKLANRNPNGPCPDDASVNTVKYTPRPEGRLSDHTSTRNSKKSDIMPKKPGMPLTA